MLMLSHFNNFNYQATLEGADYMISIYEPPAQYHNYKGAAYIGLENYESACVEFEKATNLGDANAKVNYEQYCKNNTKLSAVK